MAPRGQRREQIVRAEQVRLIRQILEALSLEVATPDEARELMKTKGADQVGF